jgi:hypothetical protein
MVPLKHQLPSVNSNVRPNTTLLFPQSSSPSLPSSIANVLNADGIATLLQHYPNHRFVDIITAIATSGVRIGFEGSQNIKIHHPNHTSAFAHPDIISQSIQSEISEGRIKQIPYLPEKYFCSPIGLVPKSSDGIQVGWRTIFDLSSPENYSVNAGIPVEYGTLSTSG